MKLQLKLKSAIFVTEFLSYILFFLFRFRKKKGSVLHISYMVHIPYYTVKILRENGVKADYLAIGEPGKWPADYVFRKSYRSPKERIREFTFFWKVVARYEIIHSHFMLTLTESAWEMKFFKMMGGKWVVHGRGCGDRDREVNIRLHPEMNICEDCDYNSMCMNPVHVNKRKYSLAHADHFFVTTPDLKDFVPHAEHLPFFTPPIPLPQLKPKAAIDVFRILHVTNHPGIEGTRFISRALDNLKSKGYKIEFIYLKGVENDEVLSQYKNVDLSVGKMKMGYYANAQIESLYFGVPAITYVREEFITEEIKNSGLILSSLATLEGTIKYYIDNPDKLREKRKIAQESVLHLHNNSEIAQVYKKTYERLLSKNKQ